MDIIQTLLGNLLLVLAGLALVLLAVMLLLVQANVIVRLAGRLTTSLRSHDHDAAEHRTPAGNRPHTRSVPREGGD